MDISSTAAAMNIADASINIAAAAINPARSNPFANFSNVMLADAMGEVETQIKALEKRRDSARAEMTRRRLNAIEGACFIVTKAIKTSMRFSAEAAKTLMGEAWYDGLKAEVKSTTYTVIAKPKEADAAVPQMAPEAVSPALAAAEALFRKAAE